MTCSACHRPESECGILSFRGECLDCEFTASTARDLETLQLLQEHGYEGAAIQPPEKPKDACPDCGSVEPKLVEHGITMCPNCGRIE